MAEVARDIEVLTYEQALAELEGLIRKLETGSVDLADSIAGYERGVALANHCARLLEQTEAKVQRLVLGSKGEPREEPMELTVEGEGE